MSKELLVVGSMPLDTASEVPKVLEDHITARDMIG